MKINSIAKNYSKALYEQAKESNALDNIVPESKSLSALLSENKTIGLFMTHPNVANRERMIIDLFHGKFSKLLVNFLKIIVKNKRFYLIPQIFADLEHRYNLDKKLLRAEAVTAIALPEKSLSAISKQLGTMFSREILLENRVDASIVAGIKIVIDGKIYDSSLDGKLQKIKKHLIKNSK